MSKMIVLDVLMYLFTGFVLKVLWGWFIVSQFHLPPIGIPVAIGITLIVVMLTHQHIPLQEGHEVEDVIGRVLENFTGPAVSLLVGFIAHLFV